MITSNKIIKYVAIALALSLTVGITLFIITAITQFGNIFIKSNSNENYEEIKTNTSFSILNIDVETINIVIKEGTNLKIETNNKYLKIEEKADKVFITEKKHSIFKNDDSDLIIYVPDELIFDIVALESGAGRVNIEQLKTRKLDFDLGAGKVEIDSLTVLTNAEIEGGAGTISINNAVINDLELDLGVGKVDLTANLTGYNQINCGVGSSNINLIGSPTNYKIKVDKGIGNVALENEKITNNTYYGTGNNIVDIDGGIGKIAINFKQQ